VGFDAVQVDPVRAVEIEQSVLGTAAPDRHMLASEERALDVQGRLVASSDDGFADAEGELAGRPGSSNLLEPRRPVFLVDRDERDVTRHRRIEVVLFVAGVRHGLRILSECLRFW
jgi:hypothetical protein